MTLNNYDYIVIGGGSAGCTIAGNLVERGKGRVLLLEAGGMDDSLFIKMPGGVGKAIPPHIWPYASDPSPALGGRVVAVPQGRVLGGSSSINGMLYVRGHPDDYDRWERDHGCVGWNGAEMWAYFRKAENNESLAGPHHGNAGKLAVSDNRYRHPLTQAYIRAGQQMGWEFRNDYNDGRQEGVGYYQTTTFNGERGSSAARYLRPLMGDPNLDLQVHAQVTRIEIENGRATGVTYQRKGRTVQAAARGEVILSAGAIGSPKILQLSGVGPGGVLAAAGVATKTDLPVGENFHDHLHVSVNATIRQPISLYGQDKGSKAIRNALQWLVYRSGVLTSPILEGFGFVDTIGQGRPDVQFHFLPMIDDFDDPVGATTGRQHGLTIKAGHLQPRSRGRVMIRSADPGEMPRIDGQYMSHPDDLAGLTRATVLALRTLRQPALAELVDEVFSPSAPPEHQAAIEDWVRASAKTVYHPVGTCRMGSDPRISVVDPQLRVHGIDRLRVADTSVMPEIPSGNTNAPTIALAEKASDLISGNMR